MIERRFSQFSSVICFHLPESRFSSGSQRKYCSSTGSKSVSSSSSIADWRCLHNGSHDRTIGILPRRPFRFPFLNTPSEPIRPFDRLPAIYPRNVRYVTGLFAWGIVFWWCLAVVMIVLPSHGTLELSSTGEGVPIGDVISVVASAFSPFVLGNAVVLLVSQLVTIRREFFGQQTYTRLSAPMIAEIPVRVIVFWFLLAIFAQLVFPLLLWPLSAAFDTIRVTEIAISALVIFGKLTVEWSTFRSRWVAKSDGIARWFTHEDPQSGQ